MINSAMCVCALGYILYKLLLQYIFSYNSNKAQKLMKTH